MTRQSIRVTSWNANKLSSEDEVCGHVLDDLVTMVGGGIVALQECQNLNDDAQQHYAFYKSFCGRGGTDDSPAIEWLSEMDQHGRH